MKSMESKVHEALQLLRLARNNMSKEDFLSAVHDVTNDNNVAAVLMLAATQVSLQRMKENVDFNSYLV